MCFWNIYKQWTFGQTILTYVMSVLAVKYILVIECTALT